MLVAVIDIGTNTVLLLVCRVDRNGVLTPIRYEQRIPRLGSGVDAAGILSASSMERTADVLAEFRRMALAEKPDAFVACATSAVREASNRDQFLELVRARIGLTVEVLSGEDEARWTYRGAISGVPRMQRATVLDIGGGSTEVTTGERLAIEQRASVRVGSVRLTERILKGDPPTAGQIQEASRTIARELGSLRGFHFEGTRLVGVAGTATSLAILAQGRRTFSLDAVTNFRLTARRVDNLFARLGRMRVSEIRELSEVMEGRADVIIAGALVLREFMHAFRFGEILVSERGVRYGIALREWERRREN